jgi:hypothetical protein
MTEGDELNVNMKKSSSLSTLENVNGEDGGNNNNNSGGGGGDGGGGSDEENKKSKEVKKNSTNKSSVSTSILISFILKQTLKYV